MTDVEQTFYDALARWITKNNKVNNVVVTRVEQEATIGASGCYTCGHGETQEISAKIWFRFGENQKQKGLEHFEGDVVELINVLADV